MKKAETPALETRIVQGQEVCDAVEAARALGVTRLTVRNWMERGIIGFMTMPSGVRRPLAASVRVYLSGAKKGKR